MQAPVLGPDVFGSFHVAESFQGNRNIKMLKGHQQKSAVVRQQHKIFNVDVSFSKM
jgi:hypothetical protein